MAEIVLECKPDETLIRSLGYKKKIITHQPCRGEVINYLRKNPTNIIGVVDDDPDSAKPSHFYSFKKETRTLHGLESYCITKSHTRLIVIKPFLEEWILREAISIGVNPTDHSFHGNAHEMHKVINTRLVQFEGLISEMLKKNSAGLRHLQLLINTKL
jgi:hypothetical protein